MEVRVLPRGHLPPQDLRNRRQHVCRVGIELEKVEVRVQGLTVSARATAAGRALPSIFNSYRNTVEERCPASHALHSHTSADASHAIAALRLEEGTKCRHLVG